LNRSRSRNAVVVAAFWKADAPATRIGTWFVALAVYGFIVTVARAHDPLGFLSGLTN
jgi:hypothetical protein